MTANNADTGYHEPISQSSKNADDPDASGNSEEENAYWLTFLLYPWVSPLLSRGWKRSKNKELILDEDLLHLPRDESIEVVYQSFAPRWEAELKRWKAKQEAETDPRKQQAMEPSLFWTLLAANRRAFLTALIGRVICDGLTVANPFLIREMVNWLTNTVLSEMSLVNKPAVHMGFIWAFILGVVQWIISGAQNGCLFYSQKAFCNMRTQVSLAIYDKAILLDAQHGLSGQLSQMHTTDSYKLIDMSLYIHNMITSPFILIGALISLYFFIGYAGLIALGIMLVTLPIQTLITTRLLTFRNNCFSLADERLTVLNEIMQGIRIVKFMGWEDQFENRVSSIRHREAINFGFLFFWRSMLIVVIFVLPSIISFSVFAIAYRWGFEINPSSVFPAISMLSVLQMPMTMLPLGLGKAVDLRTSISRIRKFLKMETKPHSSKIVQLSPSEAKDYVAILQNVTVRYTSTEESENGTPVSQQKELFPNINLRIPRGKLTMIIGPTGSGKSTLMNTLVGETDYAPGGTVSILGESAFMAQEAWVMNATLRENILMHRPFFPEKYAAVTKASQLLSDFEQLPGGDQTEIGERGVNVSGGQKQRIAFARAVYSGCELVLMDDPLSAVDSHVCSALFNECIMDALGDRSRVLVTHQVQFLPMADFIVLIEDCRICFQGTYAELLKSGIDVTALVATDHGKAEHAEPPAPAPEAPAFVTSLQTENGLSVEPSVILPSEIANVSTIAEDGLRQESAMRTEQAVVVKVNVDKLISDEFQELGGVSWATISWYYIVQGLHYVFLTFLLFVLYALTNVVSNLMLSWWSARTAVLGHELTQEQYLFWYGMLIIIVIALLALRQLPFVAGMVKAAKVSNTTMVRRLLHAPTSYFDTTPAGRVLSRFGKDMETMDLTIPEILNFFYSMVLGLLGAIGVMCYSAPYLTILVVILIGLFVIVYTYYTATNRAQKRLEAVNRSPMTSVLNETIGGLPTIRAYNVAEQFIKRHAEKVRMSARSLYSWRNSQRWLAVRTAGIAGVIVMAMGVIAAALMVSYSLEKQIDLLPVMSLGITYAVTISGGIVYLASMMAELESSFSSIERVKEYCDGLPQEKVVTYGKDFPAPEASWPKSGTVTFLNASLRYRDNLPLVLKNLTFEVLSGYKVGVVGRTGSGKSTIMLALFRMVELCQGKILIDGHDIAQLQMRDLRSKITIIPQDPLLFAGTIRSNLDPFGSHSDEKMWEVLERVDMSERVRRDGVGLLCPVSEKGVNFSVGQRQLLCLARALLKDCKVLLLDEATASVDFESDATIQHTIRSQFTSCTVLTIAHRLATIMDSHKVLVMDQGVVAEYDSPGNLIRNRKSVLYGMVSALGPQQFEKLKEVAVQSSSNLGLLKAM